MDTASPARSEDIVFYIAVKDQRRDTAEKMTEKSATKQSPLPGVASGESPLAAGSQQPTERL